MSGVTVATMIRSMLAGSAPACGERPSAAGRAMSVSASSSVAKRRSRMPVRSTIHSSEVSTNCARSSFVNTRSGTCTPRPVIPTRRPFVEPITTESTANVSVPRTASSPLTVARALPRPIGPRIASRSQTSVSSSPGRTIRLKRTSSMPAKSASRPRFASSESTATAPAWASASTIFTPGMIGLPGK